MSELSLDVGVPTDESLKISNFIGELAVRTHGSSKALVPYRACLFSALHSLLGAGLLKMSFSSASQLALRCQELVSDYKICSDSVQDFEILLNCLSQALQVLCLCANLSLSSKIALLAIASQDLIALNQNVSEEGVA